jgi:hypothetical protein
MSQTAIDSTQFLNVHNGSEDNRTTFPHFVRIHGDLLIPLISMEPVCNEILFEGRYSSVKSYAPDYQYDDICILNNYQNICIQQMLPLCARMSLARCSHHQRSL